MTVVLTSKLPGWKLGSLARLYVALFVGMAAGGLVGVAGVHTLGLVLKVVGGGSVTVGLEACTALGL